MRNDGPAAFRMAILITLKLLRQRRPWVLRGLTEKDRAKSAEADKDLADAIMDGAASFEIALKPTTVGLHSTPAMTATSPTQVSDDSSIGRPAANRK